MLLFSLFSVKLAALEVNDLYQASVIVDSQAQKQRDQAIKKALKGVFVKIGGKQDVLTQDLLVKAIKRASSYVSQYRYQRIGEQLSLVVSFNEEQINQLFEQANIALWGSLRPQVLLWLVDEEGASRRIISSSENSVIPDNVQDFSVNRGIPIIMPLMDIADSEQVFVSDFWHYFPEQVQQASMRYFADTVVVMRLSDSTLLPEKIALSDNNTSIELSNSLHNGQDTSLNTLIPSPCDAPCENKVDKGETPKVLDWRVFSEGAIYTQKYQGVDKINLINQGLSDITELIYQSYALSGSSEQDFIIDVTNVTSLKEDSQLFDFLSDLSGVKAVTLMSAQGDVRRFKLDLSVSKASLLASLKLNNKLTQQVAIQQNNSFNDFESSLSEGITQNFDVLTHHGVKLIVLGENNTETYTPEDTLLPPAVDSIVQSDLTQKKAVLLDEPTLVEVKPMLKAIPNIPIFYWEQG
jgi:hypothetical protein